MSGKQTFLHGAVILMAANIIVKIIGAVFRIPIYNLIGGEGWSYYQTAYNFYVSFFVISTAGLPIAISRMTAVAVSRENYEEEKKIFKLALIIFITAGIIGSGTMAACARIFTESVKIPNARISVLILAPALFFVCVTFCFRSYFQGRQNMIPTAVSEVIESLGKLLIGVSAAVYAIGKGYDSHIVSALAASGLTVGVAAGVIYLCFVKLITKKRETAEKTGRGGTARKNSAIIGEIIKIAAPITLSAFLISLSPLIDTFTMPSRLIDAGFTLEAAQKVYGDYAAQAMSLFNFPNVLVTPFAMSILPVLSMAFANGDIPVIKSTVESTFRVVSIISVPCALGIIVMAEPILGLLFTNEEAVESTAPLVSVLAAAVVLSAMTAVTNSMLQAQKQERKTIISIGCGIAVKLISSYILTGRPEINKFGTPISTILCYLTIMSLNFWFLAKYTGITPPVRRVFVKPLISGAGMSVCTVLVYRVSKNLLDGSRAAVIPAILTAVAVYIILILILKTLKREDILLLPKGAKIYAFMKNKNFID